MRCDVNDSRLLTQACCCPLIEYRGKEDRKEKRLGRATVSFLIDRALSRFSFDGKRSFGRICKIRAVSVELESW